MFETATRIQAWEQNHLILIVDECRDLMKSSETAIVKRLMDLGMAGRLKTTIILATEDERAVLDRAEFRDGLPARLKRLTRSDAAHYVSSKLRTAGRVDETFTPRAMTRIHAVGEGVPRSLDRIASLSLMAGSMQGVEIISPEVVDSVGRELWPDLL